MNGATDDLATWPGPIVQQPAAQIADAPIVQRRVAQIESAPENPKTLVGRTKTPSLSPVPSTSLAWLAEAHADGARKYGPLNWRSAPIPLTIYIDAMIRHLLALREGQDCAPDSGLPHLAHIMAGASIVLDAQACGTLIDDRVECRADAYEFTLTEISRIRAERAARDAFAVKL